MAQKTYIVDGRQFRTDGDYQDAMRDKELIEKLRSSSAGFSVVQLQNLLAKVEKGEFHFRTLLGQDFEDELRGRIRKAQQEGLNQKGKAGAAKEESAKRSRQGGNPGKEAPVGGSENGAAGKARERQKTANSLQKEKELQEAVARELKNREKRRKLFLVLSGTLAILFLGFFGLYAYQQQRLQQRTQELGELLGTKLPETGNKKNGQGSEDGKESAGNTVSVTLDGEREVPEILEEYKIVYNQHKKLIGWLKFDDKEIGGKYGFPVMQTGDNEYFLSHDIDLNPDKNGTIFLDAGCDVLKPSTNFILYGHHMKSGAMFGNLDHYAKEEYWKKYPYIEFDTIYEKGTYQVMYVFRSHVYNETEIAFKYYQFIDAIGPQEFDSYMAEMAAMSLYDTNVTAAYGDQLLTLSTCDYQETDGRFVVVAKKVSGRE